MASINYPQGKPFEVTVFNYEGRPVGKVISTQMRYDGGMNADVELYSGISASDLITTPEMIRRRKLMEMADFVERITVKKPETLSMTIKKVIFNPPATIIIWDDKTKTVVKAQEDEPYDPEKGMAMCIAKHIYGDCGS